VRVQDISNKCPSPTTRPSTMEARACSSTHSRQLEQKRGGIQGGNETVVM